MIRKFAVSSVVCFFFAFAPEASANNATLVYCSESNPANLSPVLASDATSFDLGRNVYSNLIDLEPLTGKLSPGIAESWSASKDGLTYKLKIRKGVRFQSSSSSVTAKFKPSRELDASDVVFSLERLFNASHPLHKTGAGYPIFSSLNMASFVKSVRQLGTHEVEIKISAPLTTLLDRLSHPAIGGVYSREYAEQMIKAGTPSLFDSEPIGSGPFVFQSFEPNSKITLNRFKEYFGSSIKFDRLLFQIVPDASVRLQKLLANECHIIYSADPSDLPRLRARKDVQILEAPGNNIGYLVMNIERKPFDDVRVRRAILHSLNRKNHVEALYQNLGEVAESPVPRLSWAFSSLMPVSTYNVEKAKALLKEAGLENGFETSLWALPISRLYNPNGRRLAELMQADFAKVGIKASIETLEWTSFISRSTQGQHALMQIGWNGLSPDPDFFLLPLLTCDAIKSGGNRSRWCNKKFDELVTKASITLPREKRAVLFKEAFKIFADEVPWIPISSGRVYHVARSSIQGFTARPDGALYFSNVSFGDSSSASTKNDR